MELFRTMTGINILHVPYKKVGLASIDLISGDITAVIDNLPAQPPFISAGRVRGLDVTTPTRAAAARHSGDCESGVPGIRRETMIARWAKAVRDSYRHLGCNF